MAQSVHVPVLERSEQAFDAASQVDDRLAPRFLEGAGDHDRVHLEPINDFAPPREVERFMQQPVSSRPRKKARRRKIAGGGSGEDDALLNAALAEANEMHEQSLKELEQRWKSDGKQAVIPHERCLAAGQCRPVLKQQIFPEPFNTCVVCATDLEPQFVRVLVCAMCYRTTLWWDGDSSRSCKVTCCVCCVSTRKDS